MCGVLIRMVTVLFLLPGAALAYGVGTIAFGEPVPGFVLQAPEDSAQRDYLGIVDASFTPNQIDAEVLLLELLNVHCPDCCMKVPGYNQLFDMLQEDLWIRKNVKLLGIAVGNSPAEVADFVERWHVAYPVVADPSFIAADATGAETTPFTVLIRQGAHGDPGIVAGVRSEVEIRPEEIFVQLQALARQNHAQLRQEAMEAAEIRRAVASFSTNEELQYRTRTVMLETGGRIEGFSQVPLRSGRWVYTAVMQQADRRQRLFAEVVACTEGPMPPYVYAFDDTGKVVAFDTLKPNLEWTDDDLTQIRHHVVGRYLGAPLSFSHEATASSAVSSILLVHERFAQGDALLRELQARRLLGE